VTATTQQTSRSRGDAFSRALGERRGLGRVREHRIRGGRDNWRVVVLDAGMDDLGTVVPDQGAVALYDCSVRVDGQFVALVPVTELLACTGTSTVLVGDGRGTWMLKPPLLAELKAVVKQDRAGGR